MSEKLLLVAASFGAMVLATAACEITTGDGGTGGHAGHHAHGGAGGTSSGAGATGGEGGSSADGGAGGEAACVLCSAALGACNGGECLEDPNYCDGSGDLFDAVYACACAAKVCGAECAATCTGEGEDAATCTACMQTAILQNANADDGCKEEGDACIKDM